MYSQHRRYVHSSVTGTSRAQVTVAGTTNPQVQICNVCMLCKISCYKSVFAYHLFIGCLTNWGARRQTNAKGFFTPTCAYLKCTASVTANPKMLFFSKFGPLNPDFTPIYLRLKTKIIAGKHEFPHLFCVEVNTFGVYPKP